MTTPRFVRYGLRTTDPDGARRFYATVLGLDFDAPGPLACWPLHEQARARGVPAHWLGNIGVVSLEETSRTLVELGSELLGPPALRAPDGTQFSVLREPSGAVLAIREGASTPEHSPIVLHQLHTKDADRAWTLYSDVFGWSRTETLEVPNLDGGLLLFAWEPGGPTVGAMANTARWPGVHTHWLYYFGVTDLDATLAKVRANAGKPLDPILLATGERIVACDDPQGAAFGLIQPA
jgi:predicted enzyme related to lactoylglutathione lyase